MANELTIRASGLKELTRDFGRMSKELRKDMQRELSGVARIVSDDAREWATRQWGATVGNKIRPRVRGSSAFAESRARSKGLRPNFGGLVMSRALVPAQVKKQDEAVAAFEGVLDRLASGNGFGRGGAL